jgi:hypothetical protein
MGSVDYPDLFTNPDQWPHARRQTDVFQFYGNNVFGFPYDIGGDNVLDTFVEVDAFQKLNDWGIPIALELGVVKFFACEAQSWVDYADLTINNIESNRGRVSFIALDEPLLGGQVIEGEQTCGYTPKETAAVVAEYMRQVTRNHPDVRIGTIETIPPQSADEVGQWIVTLEEVGAKPAFLHLDVEISLGIEDPSFLAELVELQEFSEQRDIPFGMILTADWQVADSDQSYFESVVAWADALATGMGRPTHLIFQSWMGPAASGRHEIPVNIPEDNPDVYSHTRLILEGLDLFE